MRSDRRTGPVFGAGSAPVASWDGRKYDTVVGIVLAARLVIAAGLLIDAYEHLALASNYDVVQATLSEGDLFRVEAALAVVAALLALTGGRAGIVVALSVALSAVAALLVNTYWQLGAIGPLPDMYEPIWFPQKTHALISESAAALTAAALLLASYIAHRRASTETD